MTEGQGNLPFDPDDVDALLKNASTTLVAEMNELILRAKTIQCEFDAIAEQRRRLFLDR